jgi:hypothetical protein
MPFNSFNLFPNKYFIESGSYMGEGIQAALDAGFKNIFSIEITEKYYKHCTNRFRNRPEVRLIFGDVVDKLPEVISNINEPITFWLDGHWDVGATDETRGIFDFPVCKELEIIATHPIKTHTILIDDIRLLDHEWDVKLEDVIKGVLKINPNYTIYYEDGLENRINDVLVARM